MGIMSVAQLSQWCYGGKQVTSVTILNNVSIDDENLKNIRQGMTLNDILQNKGISVCQRLSPTTCIGLFREAGKYTRNSLQK